MGLKRIKLTKGRIFILCLFLTLLWGTSTLAYRSNQSPSTMGHSPGEVNIQIEDEQGQRITTTLQDAIDRELLSSKQTVGLPRETSNEQKRMVF